MNGNDMVFIAGLGVAAGMFLVLWVLQRRRKPKYQAAGSVVANKKNGVGVKLTFCI